MRQYLANRCAIWTLLIPFFPLTAAAQDEAIPKAQTSPVPSRTHTGTPAHKKAIPDITALITCDLTCTWQLDGEDKGSLSADEVSKAKLSAGQHLLTAKTTDGKDRLQRELDLSHPGQHVIRLELEPIRNKRLSDEEAQRAKAASESARAAEPVRSQSDTASSPRQSGSTPSTPPPPDHPVSIAELNEHLRMVRQEIKDRNYQEAARLMQADTAAKPDSAVLWLELAIAQNGLKDYSDAIISAQTALERDAGSTKRSPEIQAAANNALGEAYAGAGRISEAGSSYQAAAQAQPANAAMFYSNEAIVLAKAGSSADAVLAAANRAIAADLSKPIPYYLKAQALIAKATVDSRTGRIVAPSGCREAYERYLELDPNGPMAADARNVLAKIAQ